MFLIGLLSLCISLALSVDPCTNYDTIDERFRSADYYVVDKTYEHLLCDRTLTKKWYKFVTKHVDISITKTCTKTYHCGTHIPLWMNGADPSVADGIVSRQICGPDPSDGNCCSYQDNIRVKNCGTFMVYELVPARGCSFAYCAGTGVPCPPDQWSPTGFMPNCKDIYPKMLNNPTLSDPIVGANSFGFNCKVNFDLARADVGFDVEWLFDNKTDTHVPGTSLTGTARDAYLDQKYLAGHLGETLSCRVRSYLTATPTIKGPLLPSNGYWCGIKFETTCLKTDVCPNSVPCHSKPAEQCTPSLRVTEKESPREVRLISTIPIICDKAAQPSCSLEVYLDNNNHDALMTQKCTQTFTPGNWNKATNSAEISFQVLAQRDFKKDGDKNLAIHFSQIFSGNAPPVFNGYNIPYLPIHTVDKDTSLCSCTGDPHCTTLDQHLTGKGTYFDYYKVGEFTMYESTVPNRMFQVQARTWACNGGQVTCTCGIAAREGNDIVIIDMCHTHYGSSYPVVTIPHKGTISEGTVVHQDKTGTNFLIDFPSGAQVKIEAGTTYMNVHITAPEVDYAATRGLCGTFDGDVHNDFQHPNGHIDPNPLSRFQPNSFVDSWRIPIGQSMFDLKENIPTDPKYDSNIYYCNCDQKKALVDCTFDNMKNVPAVHTRCPGCNINVVQNGHINLQQVLHNGRKKRATASLEADSAPTNYFFDYGFSFTPTLRDFPTVNGKTEADAYKACNDAFHKNPTIQQCITQARINFSNHIDMCVEDFKYFDDGHFIQSAISAAVMTCLDKVLTNVSFYDANGQPPAFISSNRCPNDCSGHGTCVHGTCNCDAGYVEDGCEINARVPPKLYGVVTSYEDSVLCDVTVRPCETIFVVGDNFYLNSKLQCLLKELKFDGTSFIATGRKFVSDVVYNNMRNVGCVLPNNTETGGQVVIGFNISISNDGHLYSSDVTIVRTDSTCLNCRDSGEECQITADTCLIGGVCYSKDDTKEGDVSLKCDPSTHNMDWTSTVHVHVASTLAPAPLGGVEYKRFDIWTTSKTGCPCANNASRDDCACCDDGGCQCPAPNQHQCTICGSVANCGNPQPGPDMGVDGYTIALADCPCVFDKTQFNCACCSDNVNACPCGREHRNQCVDCNHMEQCGNKPWIFGPSIPSN